MTTVLERHLQQQRARLAAADALAEVAEASANQFANHAHRWMMEAYHCNAEKEIDQQSNLAFSKMAEDAREAILFALREYREVSGA